MHTFNFFCGRTEGVVETDEVILNTLDMLRQSGKLAQPSDPNAVSLEDVIEVYQYLMSSRLSKTSLHPLTQMVVLLPKYINTISNIVNL